MQLYWNLKEMFLPGFRSWSNVSDEYPIKELQTNDGLIPLLKYLEGCEEVGGDPPPQDISP